jgi:hypothetical protein
MDINSIQNSILISNSSIQKINTAVTASESKVSENSDSGRYDTYEKSNDVNSSEDTGIYSKESIAEQLKLSEEQRQESFNNFIRSMVTDQIEASNFSLMGLNLNVTEADSTKALDAISEGGEYSVDSVATRIMDMAEALAGGDETKLSLLRQAVADGFGDAAKKLGLKDDEMPDITKQTYNEVMNRFDKWEKSFSENEDEATTTEKA